MTKQPAVYILSSKRNGTLYVGVTSDLRNRTWIHNNEFVEGFTRRYGVHRLVYYELHPDMISAITREKQIKKWNRAWKLELIEKQNPDWSDLWNEILGGTNLDSRVRGNDTRGDRPTSHALRLTPHGF